MPTKYATAHELESYKETIAQAERVESNPGLLSRIDDRKAFKTRKTAATAQLEKRQAPTPVDDTERETLRHRQQMLEAFIKLPCGEIAKPEMPSQHEMWETPAGAVGKHRLWENSVKNYTLDPAGNPVAAKGGYGAVFEWKDNQRRLRGEEEEWDRDIANVEKLRSQNRDNSSFADYRKMTFAGTPKFKANYDDAFPDHQPTQVEAKLAEAKEDSAPVTAQAPDTMPPAPMADKPKCIGTKADGSPCGTTPIKGTDRCRWHTPKVE